MIPANQFSNIYYYNADTYQHLQELRFQQYHLPAGIHKRTKCIYFYLNIWASTYYTTNGLHQQCLVYAFTLSLSSTLKAIAIFGGL